MPVTRKQAYKLGDVMPKLNKGGFVTLDGDQTRVGSIRLLMFKVKGTSCSRCGLEGSFFMKEQDPSQNAKTWFLNLYGVCAGGERVLMTKDHIVPWSRGGRTTLENLQPMCEVCNQTKANKLEDLSLPKLCRIYLAVKVRRLRKSVFKKLLKLERALSI